MSYNLTAVQIDRSVGLDEEKSKVLIGGLFNRTPIYSGSCRSILVLHDDVVSDSRITTYLIGR